MGLWARKSVECFTCSVMGHTSRNLEDGGAGGDLNCGCLTQETSEKTISVWPRDHFRDILVKKVAAFCPCLKNLRLK